MVLERSVPSSVVQIVLTGFAPNGETLYGPAFRDKAAILEFENVPLECTQVQLEFRDQSRVLGLGRIQVRLSPDEIFVISNPDFEDVEAILSGISLEPPSLELAAGSSGGFRVVGRYNDGSVFDLSSSASWESSSDSIQVGNSGNIMTSVPGKFQVSARFGSFIAEGSVNVTDATVAEIKVEPAELTLPSGLSQPLAVTALFTNGSRQDVTSEAQVTVAPPELGVWETAPGFTGGTPGNGTLNVEFDSFEVQAVVTVSSAVLQRIEIVPEAPTTPLGLSVQLMAAGHYSDGSIRELVEGVNWLSQSPSSLGVSSTGLATGHVLGTTEVQASLGNVAQSVNVTVTDAVVERVALTANPELFVGRDQQIELEAHYSDGSTSNVTSEAAFLSNNPASISITTLVPRGIAQAHSPGVATITGAFGGEEDSVAITALPNIVESLVVLPDDRTIEIGDAIRFNAVATMSDGSQPALTNLANWTISPSNLASLTDTSVVSALAVGVVQIQAEIEGVRAETDLTIVERKLLNKFWLGATNLQSRDSKLLWVLRPDDFGVETPGGLVAMEPNGYSVYDFERKRVYLASRNGLNVMDARTGTHVGGSPYHDGDESIGTTLFPANFNGRGFRLFEVAFDSERDKIYLATSHGLQVMDADSLTLINENPIPASVNDFEAKGVAFSPARDEIYLLTSEQFNVSGDNNAIAVFDADSLSPVPGSPFIPPGIQTLMYSQLALDETRSRLYATSINTFTQFDTESRTFTTRSRQAFSGGGVSEGGQIYIPEEDILAMVDFNRDALELYEGESLSPVAFSPIALSGRPSGVAYDPEARRLAVTSRVGLEVFDIDSGDEIEGSPFTNILGSAFRGFSGILRVP